MIGESFGFLTVVAPANTRNGRKMFLCKCECGGQAVVDKFNLLRGNSKSCGCLKRRTNDLPFAGATNLREYQIWKLMRIRCYDPEDHAFKNYGGRGIQICERWKLSFSSFLADMGYRPSPQHTLDRRDTNGDYTPENCRWATWKTQQRNRRNNRLIEYRGEIVTLAEWAERTGLPHTTLFNRLDLLGWSVERALTTPRLTRRTAS